MKRAILIGLMIGGLVCLSGVAFAGQNDTMNLLVTPETNVSVNIYVDSYNFGIVALAATTRNTYGITVENDGGQSATWQDHAADSTNAGTGWTLGTSASENQFALYDAFTAFGTSQPGAITGAVTDGYGPPDAGTVPPTVASDANKKLLWFKLEMPTTITAGRGGENTILYTVGAYAVN